MSRLLRELRVERSVDVEVSEYQHSLREVRNLWLPPRSVVEYLDKAGGGGMSPEAATWLRRVKVALNMKG